MASSGTRISSEAEKGILLSKTEENGIVTKTYIAPLLEPKKVEIPKPSASPKEYPMPYCCLNCGNGIGSSGAFTMHLRACQRNGSGVDHKEELPAKIDLKPATRENPKPAKSYLGFKNWSPFQCIFCRKEFKVKFEKGQVRRRYACDDCGQKARAEAADRQKNPNVPKKTLNCDRCGKVYKLEGFLVRHQMLCEGFGTKRKRDEYDIHEVTKKKSEEKDEVIEVQEVSKDKQEVESSTDTEAKLEGENHEVTKKKRKEDKGHEDS